MQRYRIASIVLVFVILTMCTVPTVFSAEKGTVQAEEVATLSKSDEISIPIALENADELMGFKLRFTPSGNEVKVSDVKSSKLTENGFFNHNADIKDGTFDVVWTGTEKIGSDGVICYLQAECMEDFTEFSFDVTYSQADTFDEAFNDVELVCETVVLQGNKSAESVAKSESITKPNNSQIAEEIIKSDEKAVEKLDTILEKYNYNSPDDVSDEQLENFISDVSNSVDGFEEITKDCDDDEKLEIVKDILDTKVDEKATEGLDTPSEKTENDYTFIIVISVVCVAVVLVVTALLIIRRKKHEKDNL